MPQSLALELAFGRFAAAVALLDLEFRGLVPGLSTLALEINTLVVLTTGKVCSRLICGDGKATIAEIEELPLDGAKKTCEKQFLWQP